MKITFKYLFRKKFKHIRINTKKCEIFIFIKPFYITKFYAN